MILFHYCLFLLSAQLTTVVAVPSVLFPLYIYPSTDAWQPLYWALGNYTRLTFKVILNPNDGPAKSDFPSADLNTWVTAVEALNKYPNAKTFGYVDTAGSARSDDDIVDDIDAWLYGDQNLVPTGGIFFDQVVTDLEGALWQLNNVAAYARADGFKDIIFNPGNTPAFPDPRYPNTNTVSGVYSIANQVLVFEDQWNSSNAGTNVAKYITANNHGVPASNLTAAVYAFPNDSTSNNVKGGCSRTESLLCNFVKSFNNVVESVYISNLPVVSGNTPEDYSGDYSAFPPDFLAWVAILAGAV